MDVLADLLGQAQSIAEIREQIRQILERTSQSRRLPPILLQGETGTGKNLVANVIHRAGPRSRGPFVDVNCAAIPDGLLEAELFGFERGAFTDAHQPKAGLFQTANGGTIFLDEIALLSDPLQAKLLKVIDERAVRRLGGTRSEPVDVSIIAATNEDLLGAVDARRFRPDLYHRLAVLTLRLPPLRERRDDIPLLAEHFLGRACQDYGLPLKTLTPAAREALRAYDWPGNIRDLSNLMERVALLTETSRILPETLDLPSGTTTPHHTATAGAPPGPSLDARVETWERQELLRALEATRWNVVRAAVRLGITRGTIRYRIDKYGLEPPTRRARRHRPPSVQLPPPVPRGPLTLTRWERRMVALLDARIHPLGADNSTAEFGRDLAILVQKVESFAGRVEEAGPTRIMAAFGVDPSEDAPRRAALAAMAMQKALGRGRQSEPRRAAVTIVVHADQCAVGDIGGRLQIDSDAKRRMVSALEELRTPTGEDTVLISDTARSFLGPRFEVDGPDEREGPPSRGGRLLAYHQDRFGLGGRPGPFVGRRDELEVLGARWQEALQGRGQIVAVVGEPGIGKSRLLFEFRRALGEGSLTYLEGRGQSYGGGVPYLPVVELLKGYFHLDERDEPPTTGEKVTAQLLALDRTLAADVVPILALLDAPVADPQWESSDPAQRRQRTLDALKRLVLRMSQEQAVLLVIEDLHWIDSETEAFLDRLTAGLSATRLLVLVSYRPEYRHGVSGPTSYTQLHLDPLARASAAELLRALVGDDAACEPLNRLLLERTDGNPFFLEESVRTLIETRALVGDRGAYRPTQDVDALEVPSTVRAVLATRIDRLTSDERQILQAAAVVGKDVPFQLLQAVADVPEATLRGAIANLQAAEFVRETRFSPDVEYTFKHALTHEVAYGALPPDRRRALHARMVEALERLHADRPTEHLERLTHHALGAELWPQALTYGRQAGTKAAWRSSHREAVQYFEHALRAIRRLPASRATQEETLDVHHQLGWSLVGLGQYSKLAEILRDAEALAEALDDRHRLGEFSVTLTRLRAATGDREGAVAAGQRARTIGAALGDRALEIRASYQLGGVYRQTGDYQESIREYRTVVDTLRGDLIRERFGEPSVLSVHARSWLATALAEVGRFSEGIAAGEDAVRIAEEADNAYSVTNSHFGLGTVYLRQGTLERAIPLLERAVSLARDGSSLLQLSQTMSALGASFTLAGRVADALPLLQHSVETASATGSTASDAACLVRLAEAKLLSGHAEEAFPLATRALEAARTRRQRGHEAWALHLRGDIAATTDAPHFATAESQYAEALALADALGMRPLIARCHASLGRLYRLVGQPDQAREHLGCATTMLHDMDMRLWLPKVEAEMKALGG